MPTNLLDDQETSQSEGFDNDAWERSYREPDDPNIDPDGRPKNVASRLNDAERDPFAPQFDRALDRTKGPGSSQAAIKDAEEAPDAGHVNNWSGQKNKIQAGDVAAGLKNPAAFARNLMKAGIKNKSPLMFITGLLVIFSLMSLVGPSALLVNLKENLVINWDQQNYSAEIRTRKLLATRLSGKATKNCDGPIKVLCRYERPSNRLLKSLDEAGIKAIGKDGKVIEQHSKVVDLFNRGERPIAYRVPDAAGTGTIDVKANETLLTSLENDQTIRAAFRRGYNPRWANWVDDVAIRFLAKLRVPKNAPDKLKNAKNADEAADVLADMSKATDDLAADGGSAIKRLANEEVSKLAEKSGPKVARAVKKVGSVSGTAIATAQMGCLAAQIPGAAVKIRYAYFIAQIAPVAYQFLIAADQIKKNDATPQPIDNLATMATQTYTKANGEKLGSMMDAKEIHYGVLNDPNAALASPYRKNPMYNPGAVGGALGGVTRMTESGGAKTSCAMINSTATDVAALAAQGAEMAIKGSIPVVGWIALGVQLAVTVALSTPAAQEIISSLATMAIEQIGKFIDWEALLKTVVGDVMKDKQGEELGALVGVGLALTFADLASHGGNAPLTKKQAIAYKTAVANPVKLAWAQEDRLTHDPLDASNPNTFLGSITTQLLPYQSQMASLPGAISSIVKLSSGSLLSLLTPPQAKALTYTEESVNMCKPEVNPIVASSGIAAGPLCDAQFGIPVEYMGIDPDTIAQELHADGQIDNDGKIVEGKDLATWKADCLSADMLSYGGCAITDRTSALYSLYVIDSRQLDAMDNEPPNPAFAINASQAGGAAGAGGIAPPSGKMVSPIPPEAQGKVIMSARYGSYPSGGPHYGVDLAAGGVGSWSFVSVCDGVVDSIYIPNPNLANTPKSGSGTTNYLWVKCDNGVYMGYAHWFLKDLNASLKPGVKIGAGTVIAPQGDQGNSSGPHLHFQINTSSPSSGNWYSAAATTDPVAYLQQAGISLPRASY